MSRDWHHPLLRWRVRNFKSIAVADLELAPLTVVVGANSTGKTSLIQSMLLAAQAAASPPGQPGIPLNGPLVELGELSELRRVGAAAREAVVIGGAVATPGGRPADGRDLEWEIELAAGARWERSGLARARRVRLSGPSDEGGRLELVAGRACHGAFGPAVAQEDGVSRAAPQLAGQLRWQRRGGTGAGQRTVGVALRGGLPELLLLRADRHAVAAGEWLGRLREGFGDRRRPRFAAAAAGERPPADHLARAAAERLVMLVAAAIRAREASDGAAGAAIAGVFSACEELRRDASARGYWDALAGRMRGREIAAVLAAELGPGGPAARPAADDPELGEAARRMERAAAAVSELLSTRLLHLGPLRQDPQLLYRTAPSGRPGFVGARGELAFAVLHREAARELPCPLPDGSVRTVALGDATNFWLAALGLAASIDTSDRARLGLEARLRMPELGRPIGLTAVGVGVSQALPVLVMALAAGPGAVLLLEQPELHLHPAAQQRLADFLLACAASGRQLIVETHSDHLVTRLRRRIAEDPGDRLLGTVAVVLAQRDAGGSRFERLPSNRYGGFERWPEGFFEEAASDARELIRAGLKKRGEAGAG